jgi:hypothetical protein
MKKLSALQPRRWLIIIPLLIGIAVLMLLVRGQKTPQQAPPGERARAVRVIVAATVDAVPRATGFGNVAPVRNWQGMAEVSGKVVEVHPRLHEGVILPAGTVLLRIDPTDYQLVIAQAEAEIQATAAQLEELDLKQANLEASLVIEREALALSNKELQRKRELVAKATVSRSSVDQEARAMLLQQQRVQDLTNSVNLLPTSRKLLQAQLARYQVQLQEGERDLERTTVRLPFDARLSEVHIEQAQPVQVGTLMVAADGIDAAEIEARAPMARLRPLVPQLLAHSRKGLPGIDLEKVFGWSAKVYIQGFDSVWDARVDRTSPTLDPKTRTLGVLVTVANPYKDAIPGIKPPLFNGLFVAVEISGRALPDALVVPRLALHEDRVYVIGDDNRLQIRPVKVSLLQPDFAAIGSGLEAGERVVVSDLSPAIEGMLLEPVEDPQVARALVRVAELGSRAGGAPAAQQGVQPSVQASGAQP